MFGFPPCFGLCTEEQDMISRELVVFVFSVGVAVFDSVGVAVFDNRLAVLDTCRVDLCGAVRGRSTSIVCL